MPHHTAFGLPLAELDIAIVENSRAMQTTFRSMLATFGVHRIRSFDTGQEALTSMLADPPNVAIAAWQMTPMSGDRLIRTMRDPAFAMLCRIPIVTATAHATLGVVDRAFSAGSTALLSKPLSSTMLRNRLEWLVRDDRLMVEEGGRVVVEGMDEILETRVRNSPLAHSIMRATALEAVMRGTDLDAGNHDTHADAGTGPQQHEEERRGKEEAEHPEPTPETAARPKRRKADRRVRRWHGWDIAGSRGSTAA